MKMYNGIIDRRGYQDLFMEDAWTWMKANAKMPVLSTRH